MSDRLRSLIERAKAVRMTPREREEQEISFAFGNVHLHNPNVTREMVVRALDSLRGSPDDPRDWPVAPRPAE